MNYTAKKNSIISVFSLTTSGRPAIMVMHMVMATGMVTATVTIMGMARVITKMMRMGAI